MSYDPCTVFSLFFYLRVASHSLLYMLPVFVGTIFGVKFDARQYHDSRHSVNRNLYGIREKW